MISRAEYEAIIAEKDGRINALEFRLQELERLIFGAKSERFVPAVSPAEQMALFGADVTDKAVGQQQKQKISYERSKPRSESHPGRTPLPDHLPVRQEIIEPEEDTTGLVEIGHDITRKVDYTPGKLEVVEYVRPRYARPEKEQNEETSPIVQAPAADQVLPKAIAGAGLLTQIIIAKYVDHLPLYRQRAMFKRDYDWDIPRSTMGDWFAATCTLLKPLYAALKGNVLEADYLQADESRITVLEHGPEKPGKKTSEKLQRRAKPKKVHLGYMWVFRNPVSGGVFFAYRPGRGASVLHETLDGFQGVLQTDGYSAYTSYLKKHPQVELVSCLAHIRRKFFEARSNHPELAGLALGAIQYLYRIEARCRERAADAVTRRRVRLRYARPAYEAFLEWVNDQHRNNLRSGGIGKALLYAKNHLPRLRPYLTDGRIEIDNNRIENKIRPLALGRKNYLFAGSKEGARRAAMMYSFFASCRENEVNPREWLRDVLLRIGNHPVNRLEELLPAKWAENRKTVTTEEE